MNQIALEKHLTWQFEYIRDNEVIQRLAKKLNREGCNYADCDTENGLTFLDQVAYFDPFFGFDNFVAPVEHVELA